MEMNEILYKMLIELHDINESLKQLMQFKEDELRRDTY